MGWYQRRVHGRREAAKNKPKNENNEQNENAAPKEFVENNSYQGAKGILTDPEKDKKIRRLNDKIASIQKIKQQQKEGKPLEKNQIEKLSKEQEFLDELKALKL